MNDEANDLEIRLHALESVLGKADKIHLHGVIPFFVGFDMGGTPDVVTFSNYHPVGKLYVTCELVGTDDQILNRDGQYELAVCQEEPEKWALDMMLKLAHYTLETPLNDSETMDIGPAVPDGSDIAGLLFRKIATYEAFGKPASIICCVGITRPELQYRFDHGPNALIDRLPNDYILTETNRPSFV